MARAEKAPPRAQVRAQSDFNSLVRRETEFNGLAMVKLKLTQTYRRFLRDVSGQAPLPPGLTYNNSTENVVRVKC